MAASAANVSRSKGEIFYTIFVLLVCSQSVISNEVVLKRDKRYLIWPEGTNIFQLIVGIGIPLTDIVTPSVTIGYLLRAGYSDPANSSYFTHPEIYTYDSRKARDTGLSRWNLYKMLQQESEVRGHGGRDCILRSICQAAEVPMDKHHGLFEEFFHAVFTPSTTNEEPNHHGDNEYYAAEFMGKKHKGKCDQIFPECKHTFLDIFTNFFSHLY